MSEWSSKETQRALAELAEPLPGTRIGPQLHAFSDAQLIDYERMIEARVRAEVAGQINTIADMLDGLALREQGGLERYDPAAEAFRRSAGIVRTLAAGSSPDTTERCGICGGLLSASGCERHHNTTPEES